VSRGTRVVLGSVVALLVALLLGLAVGSTTIPLAELASNPVIRAVRVPETLTAALVGAGLAVAGVVMQTLFANPLAEPYVLGVSAGASLGVALVVSASGAAAVGAGGLAAGAAGLGALGLVVAAAVGAGLVVALMLTAARLVGSSTTLLLVGVMIGAAVTAVVGVLLLEVDPERAQQFVAWGLGSVSATAWRDLAVLAPVVGVPVLAAVAVAAKPLDALLLGGDHARTVGVRVRGVRTLCLVGASVVAGGITAYCGPIAFLGMAVPHVARIALGSPAHRALLPTAALLGAAVACVCAVLAHLPGTGTVLPFNVITALVGAPVVAVVLLRNRTVA
jgi:iron complex transport system permease protein